MASVKEFVTRFNIGAVWTGQRGVNQATAALHKTANAAQRAHTRVQGMYKSMVGALATFDLASRAVAREDIFGPVLCIIGYKEIHAR